MRSLQAVRTVGQPYRERRIMVARRWGGGKGREPSVIQLLIGRGRGVALGTAARDQGFTGHRKLSLTPTVAEDKSLSQRESIMAIAP